MSAVNETLLVKKYIDGGERVYHLRPILSVYLTINPPTKYLNYDIISAWKKEMQEH
jgi:hypothetical protein